ncbi:hypothetical protein NDU88_006253 [Pleurodeles waltl]|uniref:Uncharacterized protein n=1 Tax=Pleurodeles waltl TaxID=8319 RepID=A0AAV7TEA4_PLEWA|nr:hypothetical protein NDU88_006253 [Pleurodeles waltl]
MKISPWGPEISQDKGWQPLTFGKAAMKHVELRSCLRLWARALGLPQEEEEQRGVPLHSPSLKRKGAPDPIPGPHEAWFISFHQMGGRHRAPPCRCVKGPCPGAPSGKDKPGSAVALPAKM